MHVRSGNLTAGAVTLQGNDLAIDPTAEIHATGIGGGVRLFTSTSTTAMNIGATADVAGTFTVTDNALTQPWTAKKQYRRDPNPRPVWEEMVCTEDNLHVRIGHEDYMISADGLLMPAKKDQRPPDLRYFKQARD